MSLSCAAGECVRTAVMRIRTDTTYWVYYCKRHGIKESTATLTAGYSINVDWDMK